MDGRPDHLRARGQRRRDRAEVHALVARAGRVHVPLQHEVGVLPPEPEGFARGWEGNAVSRRPAHQHLGLIATSDMDAVFKALADPSRRRMLDSLNARAGQNLTELCAGLDMARQSVSKHLAVLEAANLVTTVRRGREKLHYLNAEPINEIEQRWINEYDRSRIRALGDLKHALEDTTVENPQFVYTTYINATPEMVWKGITDPAFTKRYWDMEFITDWKVGSPITWVNHGVTIADPEQRVLESDPFRHLSYTWHSFTPEFAKAVDIDEA